MLPYLLGTLPTGNQNPETFSKTYFTDVSAYYTNSPALPVLLLNNFTATNMQLAYLFGTLRRTRDLWPTFGCNIPNILYEPCDTVTGQLLRNEIIVAVQAWQPRIELIISRIEIYPIPDEYVFVGNIPYRFLPDGSSFDSASLLFKSRIRLPGETSSRPKPPIGDGRPMQTSTRSRC
jgi:hypothetical protein